MKNDRLFAGYTLGYNHSLFSQRVHDILSAITYVKHHDMHPPERIDLIGIGETAAPLVIAARAQAKDAVKLAVVDTAGFRFANVGDWQDPKFLPGGAKYFDLPGMLALAAPQEVAVSGESDGLELVTLAYKTAGKPDALKTYKKVGWEALQAK